MLVSASEAQQRRRHFLVLRRELNWKKACVVQLLGHGQIWEKLMLLSRSIWLYCRTNNARRLLRCCCAAKTISAHLEIAPARLNGTALSSSCRLWLVRWGQCGQ